MLRRGCSGMLLVLSIMGCEDKAKPKYGECLAAEAKGDVFAAESACNGALTADPTSTSGKEAAKKLKEMQPALDKAKKDKAEAEAKAKAEAEAKAAAARAAQEAEDAKCAKWSTICTLGRHYDGSENTTGLQTFPTKAKCEAIGAEMGLRCDPCRCWKWK